MANLNISSITHTNLPYTFSKLGNSISGGLSQSSESNIYNAVRRALRKIYGADNVTVSCNASWRNNCWNGICKINNVHYDWIVQ